MKARSRVAAFLPLSALLTLCPGCSRDSLPVVEDQLVGRWEWVQSSKVNNGPLITPAQTGHTIALEFDRKGRALFYEDGSMVGAAAYTIKRGLFGKNKRSTMILYRGYKSQQFYTVSGNRLYIQDADQQASAHVYSKTNRIR